MRWLRWLKNSLLIFLPLGLVLMVGWYLRTEKDFFVVKSVPIHVKASPKQKALLKSLKNELNQPILAMKGTNIWQASLSESQQKILSNKWVKSVEMRRRFPDKIDTIIHLHEPALLFVDKKNNIFPILDNGDRLPKLKASLAPAVPLLRNNNILDEPKKMKRLLKLFSEVPGIGPLAKENILQVDMNSVSGLSFELIEEDVVVYLGTESIQTKALQVLRVIDYLKSQKQKARVIDASFSKKVLVRLRKRS